MVHKMHAGPADQSSDKERKGHIAMMTWAYVFLATRKLADNGLHFLIAMGCDVAIFYYIACAVTGHKP
jgi:hypothetical protein